MDPTIQTIYRQANQIGLDQGWGNPYHQKCGSDTELFCNQVSTIVNKLEFRVISSLLTEFIPNLKTRSTEDLKNFDIGMNRWMWKLNGNVSSLIENYDQVRCDYCNIAVGLMKRFLALRD
jgi:hypothetical protein